jgi:hypothetical protein
MFGVPYSLAAVSELGGLVGAFVHGGGEGDQRVVRLGEDAAALVDLVAVEAHDERLVGRVPGSASAPTMPLATASQLVMPPKTFTNTLLTCGRHRG